MTRALDGLTILIPESRELDLFAAMLEAEGATALRSPLVQILDLDDRTDADIWIDRFIGRDFADLILLTGEGLRRLLSLSEQGDRRGAFIDALAWSRTVTRGPKPARVLRELGLSPTRAAPTPTSEGVLDALTSEDLRGRSVGAQLYPGPGALRLVEALRERGAQVFPVTPYRYASQIEAAKVADTIRALAAGNIGMVAFTSSPQIDRLFDVARAEGLEPELMSALSRTPIASIGPVVEQRLKAVGVTPFAQPEASFHLKPLVRAITVAWRARQTTTASR